MHLLAGKYFSLNYASPKHHLSALSNRINYSHFFLNKSLIHSVPVVSTNLHTRRGTYFRLNALQCAALVSPVDTLLAGDEDSSSCNSERESTDAGGVNNPKLRTELKAKIAGIRSNAEKVKDGRGGVPIQHTLGVDLGDVKTGLSISLGGFAPQPLTVVRQRGDKLLQTIMQVALQEKADEFVVGLPKAWDGKETEQANKSRSFAGRLANLAARRGWRVYLQDEYGTSQDALNYMIELGSNRQSRKGQLDAYAAMALLCNYFEAGGARAQIVIPRHLELQQLLCQGPPKLVVTDLEDDYDNFDV